MISTETLRSQVAVRLSDVKPVTLGAVRGERRDPHGHAYAVCFFAISENLKGWVDHLEERQDELIGPSYYETSGDLRWNHYLYLLCNNDEASGASYDDFKRLIEADKSYARKFVLKEEELPKVLEDLALAKPEREEVMKVDVVGRWTERLLEARLDIVLDQRPVAETVREISQTPLAKEPVKRNRVRSARAVQPLATKFLETINLAHFRAWPAKKSFEQLGSVNLIVGNNGAGKTSLLEGIEFFYCQENARTASPIGAHVKGKLQGLAGWQETRAASTSAEAKQRNLEWYGQRDLRGSTLCNSFARFNFLATDEAVMLGQRNTKLAFEELLSRLVAGPQAAELWDHMTRLTQPLSTELTRLRGVLSEVGQRKAALEALIKTTAIAPKASDSDFSALAEDLSRLGWVAPVSRENLTTECVPALTRASSVMRELIGARLGIDRVSSRRIDETHRSGILISEDVDKMLAKNSDIQAQLNTLQISRRETEQAIKNLKAIQAAQQSSAFDLATKSDVLSEQIATLQQLVGIEEFPLDLPVWLLEVKDLPGDAVEAAKQQIAVLSKQAAEIDAELAAVRRTQSATKSMLAEIRSLAKRFITHAPDHVDCPVCATPFMAGQLAERMETLELESGRDITSPLLGQLVSVREQLSAIESRRRLLENIDAYAKRRAPTRPANANTAGELCVDFQLQRQNLEQRRNLYAAIVTQLSNLASTGLDYSSIKNLEETATRMNLDVLKQDEVAGEMALRQADLDNLEKKIEAHVLEQNGLTAGIYKLIRGVEHVEDPIDVAVQEFRNRLSLIQKASSLLIELGSLLVVDEDIDLASVAPLIESAKAAAERFAKALQGEAAAQASEKSAREQLLSAEGQIVRQDAALKRVQYAIEVLSKLLAEDSLLAATDEELNRVQAEMASIFRRIHSPHEYGVRRDTLAPLFRLDKPNQSATLRDVSTGQRAAFVLSLFLAMNSKLQTAPPILLFDDPVAHIDDFNSLSFLDHLRDLAIDGGRQIFYATADDRFAGLFEHKFSFLGEKFRRFDLAR